MMDQVIKKLKDIEQKYDVKVLLAVESGSRAWGFASPDSDYDVRFSYIHKRNWYLSLKEGRDVIEELDPAGILDVSGWDLKKALTLMGRCNCAFVEWLSSPIVYYKDEAFFQDICSLKDLYFRKDSVVNHYYHMAMNNDKRYLEKRGYELKRFLYYIRGLLAAKWAMERETYPPVPFMELVNAEIEDTSIKNEIIELVRLKSQSSEHNKTIVNEKLVSYASYTASMISNCLAALHTEEALDFKPLDNLFLKTVGNGYTNSQ